MRRILATFLAVCLSGAAAFPAAAADDLISLGVGRFDVFDGDEDAIDMRAEYRWGDPLLWQIRPLAGIEATTDGAVYGAGGVFWDWAVSPHVYITPSAMAGLYHDGSGKDLGHIVQFRGQVEAAYEFTNLSRVSVGLSHTSNAHLDEHNPGAETVSIYYHIPAAWLGLAR